MHVHVRKLRLRENTHQHVYTPVSKEAGPRPGPPRPARPTPLWRRRYRRLPEELYEPLSRQHPLILTRMDVTDARLGEELDSLPFLERLLRCENPAAHDAIAGAMWDAASDAEAQVSRVRASCVWVGVEAGRPFGTAVQ